MSGITTARATATIQLSAIKTAQARLSDMQRWTWAGLGTLVLLLVIMAQYALRHRRRQVPA